LALLDCDPNIGKSVHQPFRDWNSLKASFSRARTAFRLREFGVREVLTSTIDYQRIKRKMRRADRSRRAGRAHGRVDAEGYLALALRDYELRPYPGNMTLFIAQDEPRPTGEAASAWKGTVLGGCETRVIPGTHRTILNRPQVISLAHEIRLRMPKREEQGARSVVA
jgi:thioesterase domain-containing protein